MFSFNKGYLKLVDFGKAKKVKDFTNSIVGSPHFMAPEVVNGQPYNAQVDYWAAGIIIFEMMYSILPFGNDSLEPINIYREICYRELFMPEHISQFEIMNKLIKWMLAKKINNRLCDANSIKEHAAFNAVSFV